MMRRLLVGVGELDQVAVVVGPADETDAGRQIVPREAGGNDDRRHVD